MVSQVLALVAAGKSAEVIVSDYFTDLTPEDVSACVRFAQRLVDNEDVRFHEERLAS
jgi:uncharacterized protein (DUF433 family)